MSNQPKYRHGGPVPDDEVDDSGDDEAAPTAPIRDRVPIVGGLVAGAGAFLATYVIAALVTFSGRKGLNPWEDVGSPPHLLTEASWAVLINLGAALQQGGEQMEYTFGRVGMFRFAYQPIYSLLVFAAIVGAGYVVADCARTDSRTERIATSLLVVPAYLALATVLAILAKWEPTAEMRQVPRGEVIAVDLVDAVLYAGVLVPALLALLGGLLAVGHRVWVANRDPR